MPGVIDRDIRQNVGRALDKLEREAARDVPCLFVDLVSFLVLLFVMMAGKEGMEWTYNVAMHEPDARVVSLKGDD